MIKPPTILCSRKGDSFVFFCNFCQREHSHSAENGHRVAHCHSRRSPYHSTGYVLKERTNHPEAIP